MPNAQTPLTPWELAEAEAQSDVIDADLECCGSQEPPGASAAARQTAAGSTALTDAEVAHAECESDLSQTEPAP